MVYILIYPSIINPAYFFYQIVNVLESKHFYLYTCMKFVFLMHRMEEKTDFLPCIYQSLMSFFFISVDSETYGDLYQVYIPTAW